MEERAQTHGEISGGLRVERRQGVAVYVVGVVFVLLDADPLGDLRKDALEQAAFAHDLEPAGRAARLFEELDEFVVETLRRDGLDERRRAAHRGHRLGRHRVFEPSGELGGPQHPQRVFLERLSAEQVDAAGPDVGFSAVRIDEVAVGQRAREHVHPKVAAREIVFDRNRRAGFDDKIAVADPGRSFAPGEGDVDGDAVEGALHDGERRADDVGASEPAKSFDELVELEPGRHVIEVFRRTRDLVERGADFVANAPADGVERPWRQDPGHPAIDCGDVEIAHENCFTEERFIVDQSRAFGFWFSARRGAPLAEALSG